MEHLKHELLLLRAKLQSLIQIGGECKNLISFSEGFVKRDLSLVRLNFEIKLRKLEEKHVTELKLMAKEERETIDWEVKCIQDETKRYSVCLYVCPSVRPSVRLSVVCLSACLPACLPACLSAFLPACLLPACLSVVYCFLLLFPLSVLYSVYFIHRSILGYAVRFRFDREWYTVISF